MSTTGPIPDPEVESFLALLASNRAPRTVDAYRRDLAALAAWSGKPLARITTERLEQYIAELRAAGLSPATIARRVAAIRSFFRHQALLGTTCPGAAGRCRARSRPPRQSG